MLDAILGLDVIGGPIVVVYPLAAILLLFLLARRPTRTWVLTVGIAVAAGVVVALIVVWLVQVVFNVFNTPMSATTFVWIIAAFVGLGVAVVNLWASRWWRKCVAVLGMVVFLVTATIGINAGFGLERTLGSLLHIPTEVSIGLPHLNGARVDSPAVPLWQSWDPPADMPQKGLTGSFPIPNANSHFPGRDAVVYLPPAAQVPNPPDLPFVLLLNGQPGDPNVFDVAPVLDEFAAKNKGLAPIVLSADQLGNPANNPLCINSPAGNVETYMMNDVVPFARENLNVFQDRTYWTIAGFSNGGECAISFGAKYPEVFGNILDISGELEPDLGSPATTLKNGFNGNEEQFDAEKPVNILASKHYTDTVAIFATGGNDEPYLSASKTLAAAAEKAGMSVTLIVNPGTGHDIATVSNGYTKGFEILYTRFGLSEPTQ